MGAMDSLPSSASYYMAMVAWLPNRFEDIQFQANPQKLDKCIGSAKARGQENYTVVVQNRKI